jgi:cytochrome c oxidase assembly factor CtaG
MVVAAPLMALSSPLTATALTFSRTPLRTAGILRPVVRSTGALLALSPKIWYVPYATSGALWQWSPLEDQQMAGLIMWVPASVVFAGAGLMFLLAWLRESTRRVESHDPTRPIAF